MSAWAGPVSLPDRLPKFFKHCKTCQKDTAHEIRNGEGVVVVICISCLTRALIHELGRD